jgi:hypothetical protein
VALSSTKRALIVVVILVLLIGGAVGIYLVRLHRQLPGSSAGKPPDIMSLLPPDAPVVIYIDAAALRGLQGSPLAAVLGLTSPSPQQDRDYADFVRDTGFDYERDLDRAAVAFWPAGMATPANPLGDDRVLVVADGRFDQRKIEAYALRSGRVETHGAQSFYEVPGKPPVSFQFLSAGRIAIASGKNADTMLALSNSPARDPAMQSRIDRVAGAPVFAVARMDNLPNSFYSNFHNAPQADKFVRSIRALSLSGKPQGDGILMALDAECDSMKNAFEISTLLDGLRLFGSMALSDPRTNNGMTKEQTAFAKAFLKHLEITHQDRWVRLTLNITPEMLNGSSAAGRARVSQTPTR